VNGIGRLATRPEPPTCTVADGDWQDRVQREATAPLGAWDNFSQEGSPSELYR
jgi:hypothetical protein